MCHHVNGGVADPSVRRQKFLDAAKAKTDSFKDGWIQQHDNPYVKGGERERSNPLTGKRYEKSQSHDANEPENSTDFTAINVIKPRDAYSSRRGRGGFGKNYENKPWNKSDRAPSPYQKKPKDKQPANNTQSSSKDKIA